MGMFWDIWRLTGRRIEEKYTKKVQETGRRGKLEVDTTCSCGRYRPHWDGQLDVCGRRSAMLEAEVQPLLLIHGFNTNRMFVSALQTVCQAYVLSINTDPPYIRESQHKHLPSLSVYGSAYQTPPLSAFCQTCFARKSCVLSSHLHEANHNSRDLDSKCCSLLQVPDPRSSHKALIRSEATTKELPLMSGRQNAATFMKIAGSKNLYKTNCGSHRWNKVNVKLLSKLALEGLSQDKQLE
ncbi:uncharacterized protein LOC117507709 [Thalassophryne amazonica]|uniref:uncharacterized protein LOC117507709 n=1 Tax=Thalassophryne amazonica TaxID=390379 RepID=UPI001470876B|nr:uncharacterized protein LOC117507709 [Thalassophryne amazonica]